MPIIIGLALVLVSVFGGYIGAHGKLAALWQPYELLIIGGAALGAFIAATPGKMLKATLKKVLGASRGPQYKPADYLDVLTLLYELLNKARRDGFMALEEHIEGPQQSAIFARYPKVQADHHLLDFITDCFRLMIGSSIEPMELEALLDLELEKHHQEAMAPADALTVAADGLPGFGIVAAVLGIVITMASIGGDIREVGAHVAGALVGTFLGILLAYGFVGPLASAVRANSASDCSMLESVKSALLGCLRGYSPLVALEFARKTLPADMRPSFIALENHVKGATSAKAANSQGAGAKGADATSAKDAAGE